MKHLLLMYVLGLVCKMATIVIGTYLCLKGCQGGGITAIVLAATARINAVDLMKKEKSLKGTSDGDDN